MKNILFCGPYLTRSGWGYAANSYLEALLLTGNNVIARPTYLSDEGKLEPSSDIVTAQNKRVDKLDVIIQNVLPDVMEWHEGYNIGIIHTETRNCNPLWINKLNLLDELWVNSIAEKNSLTKDGVKCKIKVVPVPVNVKKLDNYYRTSTRLDLPELDDKFVFYFIGDYNDRKNLMALVQAFHREFSSYEKVSLLFKTNRHGLKEEINEWKKYSRTRTEYVPEILFEGTIEEKTIYDIHKTGDCFVCPSRGESNCLPIADALYFNNFTLCADEIFASSVYEIGGTVDSKIVPVNTKNPPLPHIYTGQENWVEIDILELQNSMRDVYQFGKVHPESISQQYIKDNFSLEKIAETMRECLLSIN